MSKDQYTRGVTLTIADDAEGPGVIAFVLVGFTAMQAQLVQEVLGGFYEQGFYDDLLAAASDVPSSDGWPAAEVDELTTKVARAVLGAMPVSPVSDQLDAKLRDAEPEDEFTFGFKRPVKKPDGR